MLVEARILEKIVKIPKTAPGSSSSPRNHLSSAKGLPAIDIQEIRRTWFSIRGVVLAMPVILGAPGGSEKILYV